DDRPGALAEAALAAMERMPAPLVQPELMALPVELEAPMRDAVGVAPGDGACMMGPALRIDVEALEAQHDALASGRRRHDEVAQARPQFPDARLGPGLAADARLAGLA